MRDDARESGVGEQARPARLGDPEAVLALVGEVPGALVQAPQAARVRRRRLVDQQEPALRQRAVDVAQRLCSSRRSFTPFLLYIGLR